MKLYCRQAYGLAASALERAVGAAPLPLAVLEINLGAACLQEKRYAEARRWLESGIASHPDDQRAHWFLAETLKATGALLEARVEWDRVQALDPDSPEGRLAEEEISLWRGARAREPLNRAAVPGVNGKIPKP